MPFISTTMTTLNHLLFLIYFASLIMNIKGILNQPFYWIGIISKKKENTTFSSGEDFCMCVHVCVHMCIHECVFCVDM